MWFRSRPEINASAMNGQPSQQELTQRQQFQDIRFKFLYAVGAEHSKPEITDHVLREKLKHQLEMLVRPEPPRT